MSKSHLTVVVGIALALSTASFAGLTVADKPGDGAGSSRPISFDELRARCAHPEQFDVQRAPQNIRVQCTDVSREFVAAAPGDVPLNGSRRVISAVFADKFHVGAQEAQVPVASKGGSCLRFKEIERTLAVERPLSCDEVLSLKGDQNDFCVSALDSIKGANPKLVDVHDTGMIIDTCKGVGVMVPGDGKDGKGK